MSDALPRSSDLAKRLLYEGFRPEEHGEADGDLSKGDALRWAARGGVLQLTQLLIDEGADIDAQGGVRDGTALHYAIEAEHYDVMNLLLAAGASASAQSDTGQSALHSVAASTEDSAEAATATRVLVGKGADVAGQDLEGQTPLHLAANKGLCAVIQSLVELGADLQCRDKTGLTPLHLAAQFGRHNAVQLLLSLGADVSQATNHGTTALFGALHYPKIMLVLLVACVFYLSLFTSWNILETPANNGLLPGTSSQMPAAITRVLIAEEILS